MVELESFPPPLRAAVIAFMMKNLEKASSSTLSTLEKYKFLERDLQKPQNLDPAIKIPNIIAVKLGKDVIPHEISVKYFHGPDHNVKESWRRKFHGIFTYQELDITEGMALFVDHEEGDGEWKLKRIKLVSNNKVYVLESDNYYVVTDDKRILAEFKKDLNGVELEIDGVRMKTNTAYLYGLSYALDTVKVAGQEVRLTHDVRDILKYDRTWFEIVRYNKSDRQVISHTSYDLQQPKSDKFVISANGIYENPEKKKFENRRTAVLIDNHHLLYQKVTSEYFTTDEVIFHGASPHFMAIDDKIIWKPSFPTKREVATIIFDNAKGNHTATLREKGTSNEFDICNVCCFLKVDDSYAEQLEIVAIDGNRLKCPLPISISPSVSRLAGFNPNRLETVDALTVFKDGQPSISFKRKALLLYDNQDRIIACSIAGVFYYANDPANAAAFVLRDKYYDTIAVIQKKANKTVMKLRRMYDKKLPGSVLRKLPVLELE